MNWDAIGAIGEIVGATATVLTLAYLALQIRQTRITQDQQNLIATADLYQQRTAMVVNMNASNLSSPATVGTLRKVEKGQPLAEEDMIYYETGLWNAFLYHENMQVQHELGLSPDGQWEQSLEVLGVLPNFPEFDQFWQRYSVRFRPSFRALMDERILFAKRNRDSDSI